MTVPEALTVERGRAMQQHARRLVFVERVGLGLAGIAIPLFAFSYFELRGIDAAVEAGGSPTVPYFAYMAILAFVAGIVVARVARHLATRISRALHAEQQRRGVAVLTDEDMPA